MVKKKMFKKMTIKRVEIDTAKNAEKKYNFIF